MQTRVTASATIFRAGGKDFIASHRDGEANRLTVKAAATLAAVETGDLDGLTLDDMHALVPGLDVFPDFVPPSDPDAVHPTPMGDNPPLAWLTHPAPDWTPEHPYIDSDGRVTMVAWETHRTHNADPDGDTAWRPPADPFGYHMFHQGATDARLPDGRGAVTPTGSLCVSGHAPDHADIEASMRWYNDPAHGAAQGRIIEVVESSTAPSGWEPVRTGGDMALFVAALTPGKTYRDVARMKAGCLSGDWRWVTEVGALGCLGPCLVNRGGLPRGLEQAFERIAGRPIDHTVVIASAGWDVTRDDAGRVVAARGKVQATGIRTGGRVMPTMEIPEGMTEQQVLEAVAATVATPPAPPEPAPAPAPSPADDVAALVDERLEAVREQLGDLDSRVTSLTASQLADPAA